MMAKLSPLGVDSDPGERANQFDRASSWVRRIYKYFVLVFKKAKRVPQQEVDPARMY